MWNKKVIPAKRTWPKGSFPPSTNKRSDEAQDVTINVASETSAQELDSNGPAEGKKNVWEEIAEATTAKKALPNQEDWWNKNVTPAKQPSSETSAWELHTNGPANGKKDVWEEVAEAITKKKALLNQEDKWKRKSPA